MGTFRVDGLRVRRFLGIATGLAALGALIVFAPAASGARNLYVTNSGSDNVSSFAINLGDGSLSALPGGSPATDDDPEGVAMTPDGKYLYVASRHHVYQFSVGDTGVLTPLSPAFRKIGSNLEGATVMSNPVGDFLYVADGDGDAVHGFAINPYNGALGPTLPKLSIDDPKGVASDPIGGNYLWVSGDDGITTVALDPISGGMSGPVQVKTTGASNPADLAVDPGGNALYVANRGGLLSTTGSVSAMRIDQSTGKLSPLSTVPYAIGTANTTGVAIAPNAAAVFSMSPGIFNASPLPNITPFSVDPGGALTKLAGITTTLHPSSAGAVTPDSRFLYASAGVSGIPGASTSLAYAIVPAAQGGIVPLPAMPTFTTGTGPDFQSAVVSPNQAPKANYVGTVVNSAAATAASVRGRAAAEFVPLIVNFDASTSTDADGTVAMYTWNFGDGSPVEVTTGPKVSHGYVQPGDFVAQVTATDNEGCSTAWVYTGHTASCNGSAAADFKQRVIVTEAGGAYFEPWPPDGSLGPQSGPQDVRLKLTLSGRQQKLRQKKGVKITAECKNADCALVVSGKVKATGKGKKPKPAKLRAVARSLEMDRATVLTLPYKDEKSFRTLKRALRSKRKRKLKAPLVGRAYAADGVARAKVTLQIKK